MIDMYEWKIIIILKSGREVVAYYKSDEEDDSQKVVEKLWFGNSNEVFSLSNGCGTENIFVLRREIATMIISIY